MSRVRTSSSATSQAARAGHASAPGRRPRLSISFTGNTDLPPLRRKRSPGPLQLKVLAVLARGPHTVTQLIEELHTDERLLSGTLRRLARRGLVSFYYDQGRTRRISRHWHLVQQ